MATTVKLSDIIPSRFVHLTPPSEENIERIRADLEGGSKMLLNVPHVFKNEAGKYELLAGHDRTEAVRRTGKDSIPVRDFTGTVNSDDAILAHFCRENLLRKDISKAAIAGEWLRKHPEWMDVRIAAESGCSSEYVGQVRADLIEAGTIQVVEKRVAADGRTHTRRPRTVRADVPSRRGIPSPNKYESADDMTAALFKKPSEAETRGAPADERSATGTIHGGGSEPGGFGPALPASDNEAGAVLDRSKSTPANEAREAIESPAVVSGDVPPVPPVVPVPGEGVPSVGTAAVVEVGPVSVVLTVLASLPVHPQNPTTDDLAPLSQADVDRLLSWGRWAQMCAARWSLLQKATAAA